MLLLKKIRVKGKMYQKQKRPSILTYFNLHQSQNRYNAQRRVDYFNDINFHQLINLK